MAKVWNEQLLSIMPDNVEVQFLKSSPIRKVYEAIMLRNGMKHSSISMRVYSDEKDIQENFSYASLSACCPNIVGTEFLELCPISREETVNISGSEMREFLRKGNKEKFFEYLPEGIDKEEVFRLLTTLD